MSKNKKVVLINPPYSWRVFPIPVILPGLGYLAETLRSNDVDVYIIDAQLGYKHEDIVNKTKKINPDFVGFSFISYRSISHAMLVKALKNAMPTGVKFVAGGPHISSLRGQVFKDFPELDYGIILDGEQPLLDLIKNKPVVDIPGLIYRKLDGEIVINPEHLEADLDRIPWPKYEDFELERYGYGISIVTSRGCPYRCIYCSCNVIGKKFRSRSAESVVDEIKYWYKKGYREFGLQEDNPTFIQTRMHDICERIIKANLHDAVFQAGNGLRAEKVDEELLDHMFKAGFRRIAFGIESASDKVLKAMRKGLKVEQSDNAVRLACEKGFFVSLFFLIGTPGENWDDLEETFKFALKYPVSDVSFYNLVPMPGTELWDYVEDNNLWLRRPEEYLNSACFPMQSLDPVYETPELSKKERIKAAQKGWAIRSEVMRRVIAGKFEKFGMMGKVMAWIYSRPRIRRLENSLLARPWYRTTIGKLRKRIRATFYR
jgi:anaerobic magnesium-protoporphyrin IX monomethyl ester cyclase